MRDYSSQNKKAWEYNAYDFWVKEDGSPWERAQKDKENPIAMLKKYASYFDTYKEVRIANICGSCGKKAIPLAILGADVTVFDISEDNRKYALEVAEAAGVSIHYEVLSLEQSTMSYFSTEVFEGEMAHARFYEDEIRRQMPKCSYRKYTISEIINGIIKSGFVLERFDEHPAWTNSNIPGEFTAVANKLVNR